jgi:pyruvate, water dikinase
MQGMIGTRPETVALPEPSEDRLSGSLFVRPFRTIGAGDVAIVGGKNAALGEMYRELGGLGVLVPNGFAVTADAYRHVLDRADAWPALHAALDDLDPHDVAGSRARAARAYETVRTAPLPADLAAQIVAAYRELEQQYCRDVAVAVRSSATAEDLPTASFAGQHVTFLNVRGSAMVLEAYAGCLASLFLERAIYYRIDNGFDHFKVALSVGIMKMVRSDEAASGVAFTIDTESGFRDVVFVTASYGLGENIVQGAVDPDEFYVHKPTYEAGYRAVLRRRIGTKARRLVYGAGSGLETTTRNEDTPLADRARASLSDDEVLALAGACLTIERHFSARAGTPVAMDVEWAKDGPDGRIFIVQARPETAVSQRPIGFETYRLTAKAPPLVSGRAVGSKIACGPTRVVRGDADLAAFRPGEVLVAETTTPDWEPVMKQAAAIVTDRGGRTCHAAIVARELGIPAVVGTGSATAMLADGGDVTVSCADGDDGHVYAGRLAFTVDRSDAVRLAPLPTKLMLTVGDPAAAFTHALLPNDGVGLARMEFVVANEIGVHPMALVHPEKITDPAVAAAIAARTAGYARPADYFVRKLAEGVGTIGAAFYPKPVVVRMSDFKSNEYAALLGGAPFEPVEDNPMIGLRGAARYTHPIYAEAFALECEAMIRVRNTMGLRNVILMIPFCRRVEEAQRVVARMGELGLRRGENGLQLYVMCEIPNNVVQIDAFSQHFDGFSIGSNDLTQLVLGVDRDSELVAFDFDERDPGVMEMLRLAVVGAKRNGRYVGICGQAPSDYPEVARFLIDLKIDSISLNPDSIVRTAAALAATYAT